MITLGVDPGQTGGLAVVGEGRLIHGIRMPMMDLGGKKKILDEVMFYRFVQLYAVKKCVIENVHAMPAQGVSSSFQFGRSFGAVEALCYTLGVPMVYASPAKWKRDLGFEKGAAKQASIDMAYSVFGTRARELVKFKADDGIAEAALIAKWGENL